MMHPISTVSCLSIVVERHRDRAPASAEPETGADNAFMFVFVWSSVITIDATMTNPSLQVSSLQEESLQDELDSFSIPVMSPQHENLTEGGVETDGILPDSSPLSLLLSVQPELHRQLPLHVRSLRGAADAGLELSEGHHQYHRLPPPSIYTSHGCLLIPVFFAAWWYYTKNMCRRMGGLLRHNPEPEDSTSELFHEKFGRARFGDAYTKWEDGMDENATTSDRFVKWINRRNVHRRFQHQELKSRTKRYLYGEGDNSDRTSTVVNRSDSLIVDDGDDDEAEVDVDIIDVEVDSSTVHNRSTSHIQWECLSAVGDVELCTLNSPTSTTEDTFNWPKTQNDFQQTFLKTRAPSDESSSSSPTAPPSVTVPQSTTEPNNDVVVTQGVMG